MNNTEIIAGIDEVIKGLSKMKEGFIALGNVAPTGYAPSTMEAPKKGNVEPMYGRDFTKKEAKEVKEEVAETEVTVTLADIADMNYNDLKKTAKELGVDAKGNVKILRERLENFLAEDAEEEEEEVVEEKPAKKVKPAKAKAVEVEEEPEEDEEEVVEEETYSEAEIEEFREFLEGLTLDEVKAIYTEAGFTLGQRNVRKKLEDKLMDDVDLLSKTMEAMGYYDENEGEPEGTPVEDHEEVEEDEEEEEVVDKKKLADEYGLNDMTVEELADMCAEYELSTKGKKQALIDRIVVGIIEGTIEVEEEDEDGESDEADEEFSEDVVEPESDEEEEYEEEDEEIEKSEEMEEAEIEVEADILAKYKAKKLKDVQIKKFLTDYYDGNPKKLAKNLTAKQLLDRYIEIHVNLVDDDGEVNEMEDAYLRGGKYFCCGAKMKELDNGNLLCEISGQEFEV